MSDHVERSQTVLVVDDERDLRELYEIGLVNAGLKVITADCGNVVAEILQNHAVDLIITDYRMPNGTGLDVLRAANRYVEEKGGSVIPVIVVTGWIEPGVIDAMKEGAAAVHAKPLSFGKILSDIDVALKLRRGFPRNRRHQPRKTFSHVVEVSNASMKEPLMMESVDISLGGIKLLSQGSPLIVNETYRVWVKSQDDQKIGRDFIANGTVRWQSNRHSGNKDGVLAFEIGMSFDPVTREHLVTKEIIKKI